MSLIVSAWSRGSGQTFQSFSRPSSTPPGGVRLVGLVQPGRRDAMTSRLRRNLLASFAARVWVAAISLAFVPIYLHAMGVEAYGLVGLYVALQSLLTLLELGLGTALNR